MERRRQVRLIDADSLKELYEGFGEYEDNLVVPIKVVLQNIDDMSTAYDLDAVLALLEKEKSLARDKCDGGASYRAYSKAIEIVKGGAE